VNVLYLSPDFVLPADRGLRVRTLSQLRVLSALPEVENVTFLSLSEAAVADERLRDLARRLPKVSPEGAIVQPAGVRRHPRTLLRVLRLRLLNNKPYLVAKSDNTVMRALVREHLRSKRFDIVYLGYIGMMAYMKDVRSLAPNAGVVLEQHNVEWQIFDRLASSLRPPLQQAVRWEARSLRGFESRSLREVDAVVAISEADATGLRELASVDAIVVPPFIQSSPPRSEKATGPKIGYIGHLAWQPNVLGLDWFCRDVWPEIRELQPDATLTIAGPGLRKGPDGALVVPAAWAQPGITTVGFVDDLEDIYGTTVAMVAPVIGGSGVRMKLLETMSAGMPTVTTTDGAAGLGVADGSEVLIADAPAAFAAAAVRLLSDSALRARLRRRGYEFLGSHHSEGIAGARLLSALELARSRRLRRA
jgi:glycosyltransferase involved in cell wall biosynthesis